LNGNSAAHSGDLEAENAFNEPTELHDQPSSSRVSFLEIDQFKKPNATPNLQSPPKENSAYRALNEVSLVNRSHLAFPTWRCQSMMMKNFKFKSSV